MKVTTITVSGEVAISRDYQSSKAGFAVTVELEPHENPKTVHREVHKSMSEVALQEARERLEQILCGGGLWAPQPSPCSVRSPARRQHSTPFWFARTCAG